MKDLDPASFTIELGKLYEQSRQNGTVTVTMKRMTAKRIKKAHAVKKTVPRGGEALLEQHKLQKENKDAMQVDEDDTTTYPCLVRAKFKDTTLSTTVAPEDFLQFQESYRTVVIAYMNSLKKKDRKKSKKRTKTDN